MSYPPSQLIRATVREMGLDVYGLFDDSEKKRLLVETILVAVAAGLLLEYLKGLLEPEKAGEERALALRALMTKAREDALPDQEILEKQLSRSLELLRTRNPFVWETATTSFVDDLVSAGVAAETASAISNAVFQAMQDAYPNLEKAND